MMDFPTKAQRRLLILSLVISAISLMASLPTLVSSGTRSASAQAAFGRLRAQDANQAEKYRKLAEAKRKEAERAPEKRDCCLAWARYYDCLAERAGAGDNRPCPPRPPDC
jgi:hypothetical protein